MKKVREILCTTALCALAFASQATQAQVRVPGFKPSTSGLHFPNAFKRVPLLTIDIAGVKVPIGNASNGLCGGMAYTVRDYFEAGMKPPPYTGTPSTGTLYNYLVDRLFDSFNLPGGPLKYLHLMDPALPDHETWFSNNGLAPRGRAWVMIQEEWPKIKKDLDNGVLSPMALICIKSYSPFDLGQNHQVLAYGYDLSGDDLTIYIYDPDYPDNDGLTLSLNIGNPQHTTHVTYSTGRTVFCFFQPDYAFSSPPVIRARTKADFDGDGKTDISIWRPSTGRWGIINSSDGLRRSQQWGTKGDVPVPGDYDGDGKTDIMVWRPSTGEWWLVQSSDGWSGACARWGGKGDVPVPGDYDWDGKTDIAVWRPKTSEWFVIKSSTDRAFVPRWGGKGDIPIPSK